MPCYHNAIYVTTMHDASLWSSLAVYFDL